ncbi:MAG: hypothetical protein HFE97_07520 [Oscillospiraceae bacterium]|nr:hypothetical protein [Oscillospiraceae bacterium]
MATTAQQVFELAMHLMDEANLSTGQVDIADTRDYKNRTLAILNILRQECYPASDTFQTAGPGKRPSCPEIENFTVPIALDDGICQGVLPYGLAAHLLLEENPDMASYFHQRYEELLRTCAKGLPASSEEIFCPYGHIELGEFSRWT